MFWVFGALGIVGIAWGTVPTIGWSWMLIFAALPASAMTFVVPVSLYQWRVLLGVCIRQCTRYYRYILHDCEGQYLLSDTY